MTADGIGARVRRKEDQRFLSGKGRYTDDINRPGQLHAWIVRAEIPHGRIKAVDTAAAAAMPGVVAIYTGRDMAGVGGLPCGWLVTGRDGKPMVEPKHPVLAEDRVRYVGDPVAVVIAETRHQARDAAEAVRVEYEELMCVVSVEDAAMAGAAKVHDEADGNLCYDWGIGDEAAVEAAMAAAHHVTRLELVNNRLVPNAIEPRCYIGEFDRATGEYTLYTTSQNPHVIRLLMGAFVLGIPESKLRVVAPDVGGGFGSKIFHYPEEAIVTWAAGQLGRAIKWTADRSEAFVSDAHGRDHVTVAHLAMDENANFLALKVETQANLGAYLSTFGPSVPTYLYGTLMAGQYRTPAIWCNVKAYFTNTVPVDAYRGAGRPEACYVIERIVDKAAREMGVDRAEIRRRNLVPKDAMPYQTPVALQYDTGDFANILDKGLKAADWEGFAARRQDSERRGRLRGIGLSAYIEACGLAPSNVAGQLGARAGLYETANLRVNPTGSVTLFTGSHAHGQGHETTFAQVVADKLGIPIDSVEVVHGDTGRIPFGMGTYGSRSLAVGGAALVRAVDKVVTKSRKIAAHMLEAGEADIEFADGRFTVKGTDRGLSFQEVALSAYVPHNYPLEELEPGLDETAFYDPKNFTYPNGLHACEVEVDPETGTVTVERFTAVDDFGTIVNPMIVEGQVHGGIVQGIGQALFENCVYDDNGQLLSGTLMDYCLPRAGDVPFFTVETDESQPCTHNPLGVKGCGEAGTIGASAAVINAVVDALGAVGVDDIQMPATPHRVWQAISAARTARAAE